MEKKPFIKPSQPINPRYLPKNEPPVYIKDDANIEDLYTKFLTSELKDLIDIINSGKNLNFRNIDGRTLIHATIKNSVISEIDKNKVIKELTSKNVSVNAMDKFNKNPLHFAAEEGYFSIVEELINLNCDINLIDNDGNSPIHIMVDKFVNECTGDEVFNPINKKIKLTKSDDNINSDLSLKLSIFIAGYLKKDQNKDLDGLLEKIKNTTNMYSIYIFSKILDSFNTTNKSILTDIIKNASDKNNIELIQKDINKNIDTLNQGLNQFYNDVTVDNNIIEENYNVSTVINKNYDTAKDEVIKQINKITNETLKEFKESVSSLEDCISGDIRTLYTAYYLFYLLMSQLRPNGVTYHFNFEDILIKFFTTLKDYSNVILSGSPFSGNPFISQNSWDTFQNNLGLWVDGPKNILAAMRAPVSIQVNDVGFPIVNDPSLNLINLDGKNIYECGIGENIIPDFVNTVNKFNISVCDPSLFLQANPNNPIFNLTTKLDEKTYLIETDLSVNKIYLKKLIDLLLEFFVKNNSSYYYYDFQGVKQKIDGMVFSNINLTSQQFIFNSSLSQNIQINSDEFIVKNNMILGGLPLMKLANCDLQIDDPYAETNDKDKKKKGKDEEKKKVSVYKGDVLYLWSNFNKVSPSSKDGSKETSDINQKNYNYFASILNGKIKDATAEQITINRIISDIYETKLYNDELFQRGSTPFGSIPSTTGNPNNLESIIVQINQIHPYNATPWSFRPGSDLPNPNFLDDVFISIGTVDSPFPITLQALVLILATGRDPDSVSNLLPRTVGPRGSAAARPSATTHKTIFKKAMENLDQNSRLYKLFSECADQAGNRAGFLPRNLQAEAIELLNWPNSFPSYYDYPIGTKEDYASFAARQTPAISNQTLQSHLDYRRSTYVTAYQDYQTEIVSAQQQNRPINPYLCMNYILALTALKILEKNLPYGYYVKDITDPTSINEINPTDNTKFDNLSVKNTNTFNSNYVYKYNHIQAIIRLIYTNIEIIQKMMSQFDTKSFEKNIITNQIINIPYAYQLILCNMNNLVLLEKYFDEISEKDREDTQKRFEELDKIFKSIIKNNNNIYSKEIIELHYKLLFDDCEKSVKEYVPGSNLSNIKKNFSSLYKKNLELSTLLGQLSNNFDKVVSNNFLKNINEIYSNVSNTTLTKTINNTYTNYLNVSPNFPEDYEIFKKKYYINVGGNDTETKNIYLNLTTLPLYLLPQNYNELYTNITEFIMIKPSNLKIIEPNNFLNIKEHFPNTTNGEFPNGLVEVNTRNLVKYSDRRFNDNYFMNFLVNDVSDYFLKNPTPIKDLSILSDEKFLSGYFLFTDSQNGFGSIVNFDKNIKKQKLVKYKESPIQNYTGNFYNMKTDTVNYKTNPIASYALKIYSSNTPLNISYNDEFFKQITLMNVKQLLEIICTKYLELFVDNIVNQQNSNFFDNFYKNFKQTGSSDNSKNEEYDKIKKLIEAEPEYKEKLIKEAVLNYIKLYIENIKTSEINRLMTIYFDYFIKDISTKYGKTIPELVGKELKEVIKKTGNLSINKITSLIDCETLDKIMLQVSQSELINPTPNIKLIGNKCVNPNTVNKFLKFFKNVNLRKEDINGNTILNRFIDQYNIDAIEKLIELDKNIVTYPNSRGQNASEYVLYKISIIQKEYCGNFYSRLNQYSQVLQNEINSSSSSGSSGSSNPTSGINILTLDETNDLIQNLILNSIYMFNEFVWVKMLNFPGKWTWNNKEELNKLLGIKADKEDLLIKSFNNEKVNELKNIISSQSNIANLRDEKIKLLTSQKEELENQIKQLNEAQVKLIDDKESLINKYELELLKVRSDLDNYKKINTDTININIDISSIQSAKLIKENSIDYEEYNKVVSQYRNYYYMIIMLLDKEVKPDTSDKEGKPGQTNLGKFKPLISSALLLLIGQDYNKTPSDKTNELLESFYSNIIDNLFSEFNDFDKFENTEYNTVNQAILSITKINVTNVIGNEMLNLLLKYFSEISGIGKDILGKIFSGQIEITNTIYNNIKVLLEQSMYEKINIVEKILDPDKAPKDITLLTANLIRSLERAFNISLDKIGQERKEELNNIISFYIKISGNIGLNIYSEIIKLLDNMEKISKMIKINSKIKKNK